MPAAHDWYPHLRPMPAAHEGVWEGKVGMEVGKTPPPPRAYAGALAYAASTICTHENEANAPYSTQKNGQYQLIVKVTVVTGR